MASIEEKIAIVLTELRGIKEDINEVKGDVKSIKEMDVLINHREVGLLSRVAKIEIAVKEIKEYITTQKAQTATIAAVFGIVGTALGFVIKWIITLIK